VSLRTRALIAVALTVGFYVLALGLAALLLWIAFIPHIPGRLILFCVIGAGAILISIVPRPSRFSPPGPRLNPAGQPRLFAELEGVARAVGEPMPSEVYITPEMNAGVLRRGRRRVMVLGLPLMQVMSISQMRAVLAHEFGHYHGGDTALGPWIYRTRETIDRTLRGVSRASELLQLPFLWYGRMFMRITQSVSRRQELAADELAARTVGSRPMIEGLRALARGAIAFNAYWRYEFVPMIEAGFQPPLADGFEAFMSQPDIVKRSAEAADEQLASARADPYDSHPPDAERIAALAALPPGPEFDQPEPAVSLLDGLPAIDPAILSGILKPGVRLRQVSWNETGTVALLPGWRERVRQQAAMLQGYTAGWLPDLLKYADRLGQSEANAASRSVTSNEARTLGIGLAGAALAAALAGQGWTVESLPGRPVVMRRGESSINPWVELDELASGATDVESWRHRCDELGIRELSLAPA
jgi:heat shock protein HtpX